MLLKNVILADDQAILASLSAIYFFVLLNGSSRRRWKPSVMSHNRVAFVGHDRLYSLVKMLIYIIKTKSWRLQWTLWKQCKVH